jgi:hypothetical protein
VRLSPAGFSHLDDGTRERTLRREPIQLHFAASFTNTTRSPATSFNCCTIPEGQRISTKSAEVCAQPEMDRPCAGRRVSATRSHVVVLRPRLRHDLDPRANAVAIALRPLQLELDPVIVA